MCCEHWLCDSYYFARGGGGGGNTIQRESEIVCNYSSALENEEYVVALIEDDSSGESAFANVTTIQTGELIDAFQIRTNYEAFDFSGNTTRTWCLSSWKYATCQAL